MSSGSLARRYAKALMEIGVENKSYERIGQDVESLSKAILSSKELSGLLTNPLFPRSEREKIVLSILDRIGASKTVINFCRLLLDRERMNVIPDISRALNSMIDELSGQVSADVLTAKPLSPAQQDELIKTLEEISGKKIQINIQEDHSLLGGVIAKVGDLVYDGSLRTQLQELRRSLAK